MRVFYEKGKLCPKNKGELNMKTKTSLLIALITAIMFVMTGCSSTAANATTATTPDTAFKEVRVGQVGNHIYIEEDFCEKRMREDQKKEIMAALEEGIS